jgi:hypothetical protein
VTSRPADPVSSTVPAAACGRSGAALELVMPIARPGGNAVWRPQVELDPATYTCPADHSDLSGLVLQALGDAGLAVARAWLLPGLRSRPRPQPFEVIVTCPGPAGHPAPHQLTCSGTYRP